LRCFCKFHQQPTCRTEKGTCKSLKEIHLIVGVQGHHKIAANVPGLPQAVKSNDTSGGGATTNIILFMRRSQQRAGLRQTSCCV